MHGVAAGIVAGQRRPSAGTNQRESTIRRVSRVYATTETNPSSRFQARPAGVSLSFSSLSQYIAIFTVFPTIAVFALLFVLTASAYWSDSTRRYLNEIIFELAQTKPDIANLDTKGRARLNEVDKAANNDETEDLPARDRALTCSAGKPNDLYFLWKLVVRRSELTDRALTSMERHCTTAVSARDLLRASHQWYYIEILRILWRGVIEQTPLTGKRALRRAVETTGTGGAVGLTLGAAFWLLGADDRSGGRDDRHCPPLILRLHRLRSYSRCVSWRSVDGD